MPIRPKTKIIIPAKEADKFWLQQLTVNAPTLTDPVRMVAKLLPYDSVTGETFPQLTKKLVLNDLLTDAKEQPELTLLLEALFAELERQAKLQDLI